MARKRKTADELPDPPAQVDTSDPDAEKRALYGDGETGVYELAEVEGPTVTEE